MQNLNGKTVIVTGSSRGIGLAIARALAEAMGGRAWADSPGPGRGSTFVLALPSVIRHEGSGPRRC